MATSTDPVCGMTVEQSSAAATATHKGTTYFFCSAACQKRFEAGPEQYVADRR